MKKSLPKCHSCGQPIWNPEWWDSDTDMCGVCTMGESAQLFAADWVAPHINQVNTPQKFAAYFWDWYENVHTEEERKKGVDIEELVNEKLRT